MKDLKQLAFDLMILGSYNAADETEAEGGDGGYTIFMMEENCEEYDNIRMIGIGMSPYSEYRQQEIIKQYMKTYKVTKQQILDYRKEKESNENVLH